MFAGECLFFHWEGKRVTLVAKILPVSLHASSVGWGTRAVAMIDRLIDVRVVLLMMTIKTNETREVLLITSASDGT